VVQEAFLRLFRQQPIPAHPVAWLYRTVRHRAWNASRGQRRRTRHESQAARLRTRLVPAGLHSGLDPLEAAEALAQLPDDQREIIVARVWGELTFEEIGDVTGLSTSTAYRRYEAGIAHLRRRLCQWTLDRSR
jgi:RNA polymerase sigma-70 factor (ECF subfamily)